MRQFVALVTSLFIAGPAQAASLDDYQDCLLQRDPQRQAAACTRIIDDLTVPEHIRALAFGNRGMVYHDKGDLDRAIADYDEAIRLDPTDALTFANRGSVPSVSWLEMRVA